MLKIDMHAHILPEDWPDIGGKYGVPGFPKMERRDGRHVITRDGRFFREVWANSWDPELRIEEFAGHGVDVQVISTVPVMFSYHADPAHALELSRHLNDHVAALQRDYPKHIIALGTVPMQDVDTAIGELQRLREELGVPGIQIGSHVNNQNLSHPALLPIFEAARDLGLAIMVHPWEMMGREHMPRYWLPWLVGMPAELSRAICSLIFGGVMERLPDLRFCFAHGGGAFPFTIGRIEHGFNMRPDLVAMDNPVSPREYIGRFWGRLGHPRPAGPALPDRRAGRRQHHAGHRLPLSAGRTGTGQRDRRPGPGRRHPARNVRRQRPALAGPGRGSFSLSDSAIVEWRGQRLRVDFGRGRSIAIALDPHGAQPSFFTDKPASARPLEAGDYIGSVAQGGSCNAEVIQLAPHCHGTHTEGRGHLLAEPIAVQDSIYPGPALARLVSLEPRTGDSGHPQIGLQSLRAALGSDDREVKALVIRTLPNDPGKQSRDYAEASPYPVLTAEAMRWLAAQPCRHLLVDSPSLDPAHDGGRLANHRAWWGLDGGDTPGGLDAGRRSVTEMIFVPDDLADGLYWLHLELSPLLSDATPSRPVLYPVEVLA